MTLVDIRRPSIITANTLAENRRWQKQALDTLDRVNGKFAVETQVQLTHGTTTTIANPFPEGVTVGHVIPTYCLGYTPSTGATYTTLGIPRVDWQINTNAAGIDLTPDFPLNHTQPCLIKTASGNQSINNNLSTALSGWDTATKSRGSVITDDGSTFTVSEAGTYNISLHTAFQGGVTYSAMQIWIFANGLASYADNYLPVAMTDEPEMQVSGTVDLAAGGTLKALCFQTNAALAARTVSGGTNGRRIMIHRLYNDTMPTGKVTLLFVAA